jgi:hypothetical protein
MGILYGRRGGGGGGTQGSVVRVGGERGVGGFEVFCRGEFATTIRGGGVDGGDGGGREGGEWQGED